MCTVERAQPIQRPKSRAHGKLAKPFSHMKPAHSSFGPSKSVYRTKIQFISENSLLELNPIPKVILMNSTYHS